MHVSKPTVSKPSRRMRWQQEAPNWGDAEPEAGLSNTAEGWKQPPQHVCSLQGWPPCCDKESPSGMGLREGGFAHADSYQGSS